MKDLSKRKEKKRKERILNRKNRHFSSKPFSDLLEGALEHQIPCNLALSFHRP